MKRTHTTLQSAGIQPSGSTKAASRSQGSGVLYQAPDQSKRARFIGTSSLSRKIALKETEQLGYQPGAPHN
jgi:hypothetical protein